MKRVAYYLLRFWDLYMVKIYKDPLIILSFFGQLIIAIVIFSAYLAISLITGVLAFVMWVSSILFPDSWINRRKKAPRSYVEKIIKVGSLEEAEKWANEQIGKSSVVGLN